MTAYNATPTANLYDLLRGCRSFVNASWRDAWLTTLRPVTVAMWEPHDPEVPAFRRSPATAVTSMSAALYVRLFPHGHCGPTIVDCETPGDLWGPTILDGGTP